MKTLLSCSGYMMEWKCGRSREGTAVQSLGDTVLNCLWRMGFSSVPELVETYQGGRIHISYLADGRKFRELYLSGDGMSDKERSMVNGFEFSDGKFVRFETPFGYIDSSNVLHTYIPDYQGNIVGVINTSKGTLDQFTDYYPYGMPHPDATGAEKNRRKFVSKELTTEFGVDMYDFEERYYNPSIPSFHSPDPLAYETPHISPYSYCHGDPVNYSDPTGLYRTREEAEINGGGIADDAEIIFDSGRGEWYIALDWSGTVPYSGEGMLTKYFGEGDAVIVDDIRREMSNISIFSSAVSSPMGFMENAFEWAAKDALKSSGGPKLKGTEAVYKALGKEAGVAYRVFRGLGVAGALTTTFTTGATLWNYGKRGGNDWRVYAKGGLDIAMAWIGCAGPIGWAASTTYFLVDTGTGGLGVSYSTRTVNK